MLDETAAPAVRKNAANLLIAHFSNTDEGRRATALMPELDKAIEYEAVGRQWTYSSRSEGMSGQNVVTAYVQSTNTINLDFPYSGPQRGVLTLRRHPRWGNDVIFRIERGQILCHSYGECRINVRFDDGSVARYKGNPPEDNSSEVVFIPAFSTFVKRLPNAKIVKVEVSIYQNGNNVFEFDVSGFKPERFK